MGFFSSIRKTFSKKTDQEVKSDQKTIEEDASSHGSKTRKPKPLLNNDVADFQLLLSLYKKHESDQNIDFKILVKEVNPESTSHKCPYCGTIHEFTAVRARACPSCGKKMIVRQGLFITEEQAQEIESLVQNSYEKQGLVVRMRHLLESSQNWKIQKLPVQYLESMGEAFRFMAQIEDLRDTHGYSFWDKAWGYYNSARLEAMKELKNKDMIEFSSLPGISWNMAQMLLDQALSETREERSKKVKKQALIQALMTLAEAAKLNADPYFITELYSFAKKQIDDLNITKDEFKNISQNAGSEMRLEKTSLDKYNSWAEELYNYVII